MSNTSYVNPFEESKLIVYPLLGTVMVFAISFNIVNCVAMIKNIDFKETQPVSYIHNYFVDRGVHRRFVYSHIVLETRGRGVLLHYYLSSVYYR